MAAKRPPAAQADLATEERRARVERVRAVAKTELIHIENTLLDVQARLPRLIAEVQKARGVIEENTAPAPPAETSQS